MISQTAHESRRLRVACLHTAHSNVDVFAEAGVGLPMDLSHEVRPELLEAAEVAGGLTTEIRRQVADAIDLLRSRADFVVLTCSTLGPVVDQGYAADASVVRADAALAKTATAHAHHLVVLCAASTTLEPTRNLFARHADAGRNTPRIDVRLVDGAWPLFKAGRIAEYLARIADAADSAFADGADVVALGQASMSRAAALTQMGTPLTGPATALAQIVRGIGADEIGQ